MVNIEVIIDIISMSFSALKVNGRSLILKIKNVINTKNTTSAWVMTPATLKNTEMNMMDIFLYMLTDSQ